MVDAPTYANHNEGSNSSRLFPQVFRPMPNPRSCLRVGTHRAAFGPWLIAIGLTILIAAAWIPLLPVVTAMAFLTLGATDATLSRFQNTQVLRPILFLHAATYAMLYGLFVGAVLHASASDGLGLGVQFDLAASILPMAFAAQRVGGTFLRL